MTLVFKVTWFEAHAQKEHSCGSSTWWPTWWTCIVWESVELHDFFYQGKCPGLSDVVIPLRNKARPHTAQQTRKLCRISIGKRRTIIHTVRIWHPTSLLCLLPWKRTCQDNVSPATKTWNVLPSRGWRNRQVHYMRLGFTNLSHSVTCVLNVKGTVVTAYWLHLHFALPVVFCKILPLK
jgi:hypothetical protein